MTIYSPTARFDAPRALQEDELRRLAPSIFAVTAHDSRSEKFRPIPTIEVLRGLMAEGFSPVGAKQSPCRTEGKRDFTKHLIRLRKIDDDRQFRVGDTVCEILLKNANDGTSAYEIMAGLFRIACLNSLVAQTGTIDSHKVRHSGQVQDKVIEGTYRVLDEARAALAAPQDWRAIGLSREERLIFAQEAHGLRFGKPEDQEEGKAATPILPDQLLRLRRREDAGIDLWSTFNVVQENAVKGGLHGYRFVPDEYGRQHRRQVTTRAVKGIDQDVRLNRALFTLAAKMAELKRAA